MATLLKQMEIIELKTRAYGRLFLQSDDVKKHRCQDCMGYYGTMVHADWKMIPRSGDEKAMYFCKEHLGGHLSTGLTEISSETTE